MSDLINISFGDAALTALLGYLVVFFGLILLMVVVIIMGKIMVSRANKAKAAVPAAPAAPAGAALAAGEVVKSPMPGNILKINVSQGQKVNEGDVLIVLEAMKMENEIVATKSGTVAQIVTAKGAVVETGAPLVVIA